MVVEQTHGFEVFDEGRVGIQTFRRPQTDTTFIGFSFGGGGAHSFRALAGALPAAWSVLAVEAPGHVRTSGPLDRTITTLCDRYLDVLGPQRFECAILYGHSVGGLIAAALTRRCEALGVRPHALILGAAPPPQAINRVRRLSAMTDRELFDWWSKMIGTVDEQHADGSARELFRVFNEPIRADIDILESVTDADIGPIAAPTMVLAGAEDHLYAGESLIAWRELLPQSTLRMTPGGHLFMLEYPQRAAQAICSFVDGLRE